MPYRSLAQEGYFHTHKAQLEKQGVSISEWDAATKGRHLPERASMKTQNVDLGKKGSFNVKKGALHEDLGIPLGEKIPESRLESAEHSSSPQIRRRAISAIGFKHMHHGK